MSRELVSVDTWTGVFTRLEVPRSGGRRRCETCDGMEFPYLSGRGSRSTVLCGRNAVQVMPEGRAPLDLDDLTARLRAVAGGRLEVEATRFLVRFHVEGLHVSVFPDGRAIVAGTNDPAAARGVYARYVGA
jgi:adenylyltransferase/sulfurtransferase